MTRKKDNAKPRITTEDLKQILAEDRDLLKVIVEEVLQQVLEAEMEEALQDRQGRFRTEVFERYQRSEKALVAAMMEMYL